MSLRQLIEPDCGGFNPLMQFSNQLMRDVSYKDERFSQRRGTNPAEAAELNKGLREDQLVNEFLEKTVIPIQTFQMDSLLQEMQQIEAQDFQPSVVNAPRVIDEVTKNSQWTQEFLNHNSIGNVSEQQSKHKPAAEFWTPQPVQGEISHFQPTQTKMVQVKEFFDTTEGELNENVITGAAVAENRMNLSHSLLSPAPAITYNQSVNFVDYGTRQDVKTEEVFNENRSNSPSVLSGNWLEDFSKSNSEEAKKTAEYNQKFWENLQDEWRKLSEDNSMEHPWLTDFTDYYDPYKEYTFTENNPTLNDENALEKGKIFLAQGDIPNAVLCFETAAKQKPDNAEVWELLGISQAENEMDPHAIAALKKSLELKPDNMKVLMALAVSYTNESLQSQALKVLISWLQCNPKYKNLVETKLSKDNNYSQLLANSLIRAPELKEIQNLFLEAVKQNPNEIDSDIQEALGVLFTLSSEYDKAVDCFRAALHVRPDNAKVWNRLGASLANGNRSVEAVEAYQRALELAPGFIRARYNVGIVCMNLKAYKQAAEHLLAALNLQATSTMRSGLKREDEFNKNTEPNQIMSNTIWSTLRMVISLMGRWDLQEAIDTRSLDTLNKVFNDNLDE